MLPSPFPSFAALITRSSHIPPRFLAAKLLLLFHHTHTLLRLYVSPTVSLNLLSSAMFKSLVVASLFGESRHLTFDDAHQTIATMSAPC